MTFDTLFSLTRTSPARWAAQGVPKTSEPRVFGGVLIGQAIVAASTGTRRCHALHAFFINVGRMVVPFDIGVENLREGGSFSTRRVDIQQEGRLLLTGHTSHHDGDDGPDSQMTMPDVPPPESLEDQRITRAKNAAAAGNPPRRYLSEEMLDARPVFLTEPTRRRAVWFRPRLPIEGGTAVHQAAIGFSSDSGLVHIGVRTHAPDAELQVASLDHSIWFHREASANDWMLHVQTSPSMAHGRGLSQASIFTRGGVLVASATQQILARRKRVISDAGDGNVH